MDQQTINTGSINVAYLRNNVPDPVQTVVFIHGYPFAKEMWAGQLKALPDNVEGIAYDIRGFGHSETGQSFFSIDLFAKDLIAFIAATALNDVVLCGISMGGYIALRAMEIAPETFTGLILCDTTSQPDTNEAKLNRFKSIESILDNGAAGYAEEFMKKAFTAEMLEKRPEGVNTISTMITATSTNVLCSALLALASRTDTTPVLEAISVPCLVIRGENDKIITAEQSMALNNQIKGSSLIVIPGSGHLPNIDNPAAFNEQLNVFLSTFDREQERA